MKKTVIFSIFALFTINCITLQADHSEFQLKLGNLQNAQTAPLSCVNSKIGGKNFSPKISWANVPVGTKSLILTCIDKNPVANNWVHWMILNIPTTVTSFPENISKSDLIKHRCVVCKNSFGVDNYGGPIPPKGTGSHKYVFTLYALSTKLADLKNSTFITETELLKMIKPLILAEATFSLYYKQ
jgi:Raf kinase inhibitor-like YbhB/YbcL family protein